MFSTFLRYQVLSFMLHILTSMLS
uniref:Uncharacterized protein n=1 Tax=Anguilla anguilla TaxID=7936 RepID=A0A0E9WRU1_ANGAN